MDISRIGQTNGMDYISALNSHRSNINQLHFATFSRDTVSISNEAMEMYMASKSASKSQDAKLESTLFGVDGGWSDPDSPQSLLSGASERTGQSNTTSKSMFSMLLESLFLAELEESGAIGGNGAGTAENERQTGEDEVSRPQPNKAKSANPLGDGDKVAQIKKVLTDFAKGKADLSDISSAIGGGKGIGKMEGGNATSNDSPASDESKKA